MESDGKNKIRIVIQRSQTKNMVSSLQKREILNRIHLASQEISSIAQNNSVDILENKENFDRIETLAIQIFQLLGQLRPIDTQSNQEDSSVSIVEKVFQEDSNSPSYLSSTSTTSTSTISFSSPYQHHSSFNPAPSQPYSDFSTSYQIPISGSSFDSTSTFQYSPSSTTTPTPNSLLSLSSTFSPIPGRKIKKLKTNSVPCQECGTKDSPEWRKGPSGRKELCNRCGLRYSKLKKKSTSI